MPLFKHCANSEYQWGIWKTEESLDDLSTLLPDRGEMYRKELQSFTSRSRKTEWLAVRVLLYHLLQKEIQVCYHPGGKPYLADHSAHISISHTKGYVAVLVSPAREVGIDIEKTGDKVLRVAHKFINATEGEGIPPGELNVKLLLIWSAKEVMFKCLNDVHVNFRDHLQVDHFPIGRGWMAAREEYTLRKQHFFIQYMLHEDFVMTWSVC